ncbi:hypothetical protein AQUCO_05800154v1 [Aquilegia coerulea]|uniref:F-box domain-containing protein n=1 Tax=Aquilegia coerulea TaxID=218851 RepID=A0A2G5CF36_AQUCA|nr:hypothetical protein AQUCO_05800154v1 [Aquilegia coerulea]
MEGRRRKSLRRLNDEVSRNWEDLNTDCLINIFERVRLESLILDIPFVCKSWYKVSLDPHCWKLLDFRFMSLKRSSWAIKIQEKKSCWGLRNHSYATPSTQFMKIAVHRSCGLATKLAFHTCNFEDNILEYVLER